MEKRTSSHRYSVLGVVESPLNNSVKKPKKKANVTFVCLYNTGHIFIPMTRFNPRFNSMGCVSGSHDAIRG